MIVSWNWLTDYVPLKMTPAELVERLMMAGLNHRERVDLLRGMRLGAPPEVFEGVLATPVSPDRDHIRGPLDAPVSLVEYGDCVVHHGDQG